MRRWIRQLFALLAVAAGGVVLPVNVQAEHMQPVAFQQPAITIVSDVNIRPTPDASQPRLALMPAGARPQYIFYVDGQNVQGTTKWFKVSWNGITGYYSSVADDVPLAKQADIQGNYRIPRCGTGADINQSPAGDAPLAVIPEERSYEPYNRGAAAEWALNNAQAVRTNLFADRTWFVSQALWAGDLSQTSYWNGYNGRQGKCITTPGTVTATSAPELVRYLQKRFGASAQQIKEPKV